MPKADDTDQYPENWIPPGLFTFCSCCGHVAHEGGDDFICAQCQVNLLGVNRSLLAIQADTQRGQTVREVRTSVARTLMRYLPEKWWVTKGE